MIVDTSAVVAIALHEPEKHAFEVAIGTAPICRMSAGNWIEVSAVAVRGRLVRAEWLDSFLERYAIAIAPVTGEQARIGHQAYRDYGQGSGHPARLNLGDCFAYALAKVTGEPLLFKGDDFIHTDVRPALAVT